MREDRQTQERFVFEAAIVLSADDARRLNARFEAARLAYNALLGEALRRQQLLRDSRAFRRAMRCEDKSQRRVLLAEADAQVGFREYDLHSWASKHISRTWLSQHVDAQAVRGLSSRAFLGVRKYQFGRGGRPRFKARGQLGSVEGKSNRQGLRYRDGRVLWLGLSLRLDLDFGDAHTQHALSSDIRYVRIVRRRLRGRTRYWGQLVCAGRPYWGRARQTGDRVVGIDPGVRNIGVASNSFGALVDLRPDDRAARARLRRHQRAVQRKRLANNPDNFDERGQITAGHHAWSISRKQQAEQGRVQDSYRRLAASRKCARGRLANVLLVAASEIRVEVNSYVSFAKRFGRSSKWSAAGAFARLLTWKAAQVGATVVNVPRQSKLSQRCHGCDRVRRKPLRLRVHRCECGVGPVQRDVYAAWLMVNAIFDSKESLWRFDAQQARSAWRGAGSRLPAASKPVSVGDFVTLVRAQVASDGLTVSPLHGTERLAGKARAKSDEALDVVGEQLRAKESLIGRSHGSTEPDHEWSDYSVSDPVHVNIPLHNHVGY